VSTASNALPGTHRHQVLQYIGVQHGSGSVRVQITGIIWLESVVEKLAVKHNVYPDEVEDVFHNRPQFRRIQRGNVAREDVYTAVGQTNAGRYLIIFFIQKPTHEALIISARDTTGNERRRYGRK
jgi:hypothetical protein